MRIESLLVPAIMTAACTLAACGDDGASSGEADAAVDAARVYDPRLCAPPTVADPLVVNGAVTEAGASAAAAVTVELVRESDGAVLASATTDANGDYTLPGVATGGTPIAGHLRVSKTGFITSRYYTVDGLRFASMDLPIYPPGFIDPELAGIGVTLDPALGVVVVQVRACNSNRWETGVNGAVVDIIPGPRTYYVDRGNLWAPDQVSTLGPSGEADDFHVPPGRATVEVTYQMRTTATEVESAAGGFTHLTYYP